MVNLLIIVNVSSIMTIYELYFDHSDLLIQRAKNLWAAIYSGSSLNLKKMYIQGFIEDALIPVLEKKELKLLALELYVDIKPEWTGTTKLSRQSTLDHFVN